LIFQNDDDLKDALPFIKKFIKEGLAAYNFWQRYRDNKLYLEEKFWKDFGENFPQIADYLKFANIYGIVDEGMNKLADYIAGFSSDFSRDGLLNIELIENSEIFIYGNVWHFADWDPMMQYLLIKTAAIRYEWMSNEWIEQEYDLSEFEKGLSDEQKEAIKMKGVKGKDEFGNVIVIKDNETELPF